MRITEDRYTRERVSMDLALRMIKHEARTCTIRSCTGLSDDRIRKLYKTYIQAAAIAPVRRRRGKSPRQIAYFIRTTHAQLEASLLMAFFAAFGLLKSRKHNVPVENSVAFGETFCDAYETYREYHRRDLISFEHAWFLRRVLAHGVELCLDHCSRCASPFIRDPLELDRRCCPLCRLKSHGQIGVPPTLSHAVHPPASSS